MHAAWLRVALGRASKKLSCLAFPNGELKFVSCFFHPIYSTCIDTTAVIMISRMYYCCGFYCCDTYFILKNRCASITALARARARAHAHAHAPTPTPTPAFFCRAHTLRGSRALARREHTQPSWLSLCAPRCCRTACCLGWCLLLCSLDGCYIRAAMIAAIKNDDVLLS